MRTVLEIPKLVSSLVLDPPLTNDEFEELSMTTEFVKLERAKDGKIIVNAPTGFDSGDANSEIVTQLRTWWKAHKRGRVFDNNTGFFLPDGSMKSPDCGYVTEEQFRSVSKTQRKHFLHLTPAFVIELLSSSDRLSETKTKMQEWLENGAQLGWLIDPYKREACIYEPGKAPRLETGRYLAGTGPVEGFVLDLSELWIVFAD